MVRSAIAILFCSVIFGLSGCLLSHSHHSVIRQGEPLYPVSFQSENARNASEGYVTTALDDKRNTSSSSLAVPFLLGLERSKTTSESAVRNDAAVKFDANSDGIISDQEIAIVPCQ